MIEIDLDRNISRMNIQVPVYQQESRNEVCRDESGYNVNVDDIRLQPRAAREFVPADKKDVKYWFKRVRNNASARKSRMKRKAKDKYMEKEFLALQKENVQLRNRLAALNYMCVGRSLDKFHSGVVFDKESKYKTINSVENYRMDMHCSVKDKSKNALRYDPSMLMNGATDSARDANDSMREDVSSNSSNKSEIDDSRTDSFSPTYEENCFSLTLGSSFYSPNFLCFNSNPNYAFNNKNIFCGRPTLGHLSLPFNAQAMVNLGTHTVTYMVMKQSGECGKALEDSQKRVNDQKIQQVPHKIRIKERIHSAFAKGNSID